MISIKKRRSSEKELLHCDRHLPRQVLTDLFTTTFSESYKQEMLRQKLKRKDFQNILKESPYYQHEQISELQLKSRRTGKCSSSKWDKEMKFELLCLCVSVVLLVPYQEEKAALQKFYFCPVKTYIMQDHPGQTLNYWHI